MSTSQPWCTVVAVDTMAPQQPFEKSGDTGLVGEIAEFIAEQLRVLWVDGLFEDNGLPTRLHGQPVRYRQVREATACAPR